MNQIHNQNDQHVDEENDELLEEIDVFYNGELNEEIIILQYPLRPADKSYSDHAELNNVMVNKENMNMKLVYSIESKLKNFDTQYYENKSFSQSLQGQKIDPNTNYCLGVFKNNILFLNPVSNFVQFRNDFSHMESAETASKKKSKMASNANVNSSRKESLSMSVMDFNASNINISTDAKFTNFKYHKKDTIQSYQIYEKLSFDDNVKLGKVNFTNKEDYFNFFFSNVNKEIIISKNNDDNVNKFSYKELMEQPLNVKIEFFLKKLQVVNFYILKIFCLKDFKEDKVKDEEFLENCLKFARILKNGNLILKSEIRYEDSELCAKRNYVINLLQNSSEGVKRSEIKFLENFEIIEILSEIAKSVGGLYYLKDNSDLHNVDNGAKTSQNLKFFINKFKNVYEKEIAFWNSINISRRHSVDKADKTINIIVGDGGSVTKDKDKENVTKEKVSKTKTSTIKSNVKSNVKSNDDVEMKVEKLSNQMIIDEEKDNYDNINKSLDNPYSENNIAANNTNNTNNITTNTTTNNTSSFNNDFIKSTITRTFSRVDCFLLKDLQASLYSELSVDQTNSDLLKTINELIKTLCYIINNICFLKEVGEGESLVLRKSLIEFLAAKKSVKKNEIKTHLQSINITVPDNLLNKVLKSIGSYGSTVWSLKEPE